MQGQPVRCGGRQIAGQAAIPRSMDSTVTLAISGPNQGEMSEYLLERIVRRFPGSRSVVSTEVPALEAGTANRAVTSAYARVAEGDRVPGLFCFIGAEPGHAGSTGIAFDENASSGNGRQLAPDGLGETWTRSGPETASPSLQASRRSSPSACPPRSLLKGVAAAVGAGASEACARG